MTVIKIDSYRKPIKNRRAGRGVSEQTKALMAAVMESAATGEARVWRGAAADGNYLSSALKVRRAAKLCGHTARVGLEGEDLTFSGHKTPELVKSPTKATKTVKAVKAVKAVKTATRQRG